ncbi:MAG: FHA domain-containing protein [Clostridia bacterium]|nr:FHA domain-containing protein [Clostridia bacterium]
MNNGTPPKRITRAYLLDSVTNIRGLPIRKEIFKIGSDYSITDHNINSPYVSRHHATITVRDGKFYLADANSANGTFINDMKIAPNREIIIKHGMVLRFADVERVFIIR